MKYKLGDEVYLKGVITSINSYAEINYLYEVKTADEFVTAAERHLEPINKEEAPLCLRNVLARLRELPEHDREVWLKGIMSEFEQDLSHAKWREGYEQGKFEGAFECEKVTIPQFVAEWIEKSKAYNLYGKFNLLRQKTAPDKIIKWFRTDPTETGDILAKAWLNGYEIEKEKRCEVKLKNTDDYLVKTNNDDYHFYSNIYIQNRKHTRKELEDAGFGWVFDCEGAEVQEVE